MDWTKTLQALAPTVASAILGPLGGIAVSAIGNILGVSDATQAKIAETIKTGQLTPEQIGKLKELELEYQNNEKERNFKYAELAFKDLDSARNREVQTKDNTNKILAFVIIGAFIGVTVATLMGWTKAESVLAGTLIGYLSAKAEQVLSYYFGNSKANETTTKLLAQAPAIEK